MDVHKQETTARQTFNYILCARCDGYVDYNSLSREGRILGCLALIFCRPPELGLEGTQRWAISVVLLDGRVSKIAENVMVYGLLLHRGFVCLLVGCLTSQQQASVSQGRICSDNLTCCHTEIEVADPTFYLTQSQYTDTGPTSPSADPITPGAWQGSHWSANF